MVEAVAGYTCFLAFPRPYALTGYDGLDNMRR